MPEPPETPVRALAADPALISKLEGLWITSAEQIVAAAATPGGEQTLADGLQTTIHAVRDLVQAAREAIPAEKVAQLETSVDPDQYGLGAVRPPERPATEKDGEP